ncbi:hypothetical protein [Nocardia africana]
MGFLQGLFGRARTTKDRGIAIDHTGCGAEATMAGVGCDDAESDGRVWASIAHNVVTV